MKRGIKKLYVHSEMVASGEWANIKKPDELDELTLSLQAKGGGCHWEFSIKLEMLQKRPAMCVKMWNDSWEAFAEAPEVFEILRKYKDETTYRDDSTVWSNLIEDLENAGWKRVKPKKLKKQRAPELCDKCGR